ncbi:vesicle trafficking 1 [Leptinotarsa decemlineata]|uniref:vesicle trafficking 1 n=1 Tax=Leptinotarsa decemlineata TaxID=7539 RepID=UPI000C254ECC|nr:vacuolar protein sorting-associated protein VTA1 homolog [Leptinotarsa decemlineata]
MVNFPPVPSEVKPLAHLLKLADEHDERNVVVAYWARMSACLLALRIVPGKKSPETAELIRSLLDWLEKTKKANGDNEGITSETIAQSLIEEYALRLFEYANQQDLAQIFNKNTVKTFYTAGMLMDVLDQFGPIPDDIREKRKYAKWKAAYIHKSLKNGEMPLPGPPKSFEEEDSAILHNSKIPEEELATYTKYTGPIDFEDLKKPLTPAVPPPDNLVPFNPPKQSDDNSFAHAPASSPITPLFPTNPTPFSTPTPAPSVASVTLPEIEKEPGTGHQISVPSGQFTPSPEQIQKAQKFCKFATSALNYDDVKNALDYLHKAMNLLEQGKED